MTSKFQLYKRSDSEDRGRHLVATQCIRKNQLIFVEKPLLALQSLGNAHQGALVCRRCKAFIGGPDICLAVSSGRLDRGSVWNFYKEMEKTNNGVDEGYKMVSCRNKCGELFCSKQCEEDMWLSGGHELMCTGLIPDTNQEKEDGVDIDLTDDIETNEQNQEENALHPLLEFKVHSVQSNEIFLMVGDMIATVISLRRQQIENSILAENEDMHMDTTMCENLDDLMAPYLDFTLTPWWEVATEPMMLDPASHDAAKHLDKTLKELCKTSAQLLKNAFSTLLSEQAKRSNNEHFCSTLLQAMEECEEKYNMFSAEFFGQIIGSFEQNALGIRARHPLCRDIIENRSFRIRGKSDIFTCLEAAGVFEDQETNEEVENNDLVDCQDEEVENNDLIDCQDAQELDELENAIASLEINEEGQNDNTEGDYGNLSGEEVQHGCNNDCDECDHVHDNEAEATNDGDGDDLMNSNVDVQGDDLDAIFTPLDGTAMYSTTCKMNHSCEPNVVVKYSFSCAGGGKFARWGSNFPLVVSCCAIREINEGEELCISYIDEDLELEEREKALENYGFQCNCAKCHRQRHGCKSMSYKCNSVNTIFPAQDECEELFPADDESDVISTSGNDLNSAEPMQTLLDVEADLNSSFSKAAYDTIPINILGPTTSAILNIGKKVQRDFYEDSWIKNVMISLEERNYVNLLERALDGETKLINAFREKKGWNSSASREAHLFFSLAGALGHSLTLNFLPAMKLIDKAIIFGLKRSLFSHFIDYVEFHSSKIFSQSICRNLNTVANFQHPCLQRQVQNECLSSTIRFPIEELDGDCSSERFMNHYFSSNKPVVVRGFGSNWPALKKWRNLGVIMKKHGNRIIPIELGNMNQKTGLQERLMSMRDFVDEFMLPSNSRVVSTLDFALAHSSTKLIAYLAQHHLFEQIPEMKDDIVASPSLCGNNDPIHVNAWIGTGGTRTPCHFDSYDNLLVQIVGAKYVRLYKANETERLYVMNQSDSNYGKQGNMSAIDCEAEDYTKHPLLENVKYSEAILYPGDCLYIPAREWHYVRSLSTSASVNYWF